MGIPIAELQERVSSREFAEYLAHFGLEPWGIEREDLRAGIVASTIANANRDPKKRPKPFTPDQFMPTVPELGEPDDEDDLEGRIDSMMESFGAEPGPPA